MFGGRVLVGRAEELAQTMATLSDEPPRCVVLGGVAGIGKTRLAREVASSWAGGATWLAGTTGASGIPGAAVLRLVPPSTDGGSAGLLTAAQIVQAVVAAAVQSPGRLVVVDDAHHLDELSALAVQQVALHGSVPVLLTVRNGEPVPDTVAMLWRDGFADRIDLLPLSAPEARDLGREILGRDLMAESADALYEHSGGNPLFHTELIRDAVGAGRLRAVDGRWVWDGTMGRARNLRDAVWARIAGTSPGVRTILAALAVAEPIGVPVLLSLATEADLEEAEDRQLVDIHESGERTEVRLAHPLYGEAVIRNSDADFVGGVRSMVAAAVEERGARRRGDPLLLARLHLDAGDLSDPDPLLRGAGRALELLETDLALEFTDRVLEGDPDNVQAILLAGEASIFARRFDDSWRHFERAFEVGADHDRDRMRIAQGLQQVCRLAGRPDDVMPALARVREHMVDPVWTAVVDCLVAQQHMFEGRSKAGLELGEQLLSQFDDPLVRLRLLGIVGSGRSLHGRSAEALAFVAEMVPVALQLQHELQLAPAWAVNAQGVALMLAGHFDEAISFVDFVRQIAGTQVVSTVSDNVTMLDLFAGRVELARGRASRAIELILPAAEVLGPQHESGMSRWARALLAEATAMTGDLAGVPALCVSAEEASSTMALYDGDAARALACARLLAGEIARGRAELGEVAARQEREGQLGIELVTVHHALRFGAGSPARQRLGEIVQMTDGRLTDLVSLHLSALDAGDGRSFERAADAFAGNGMALDAAELFSRAAVEYRREGLRSRASAASRRQRELVRECGPLHTPALLPAPPLAELTPREREVVALVVRGYSNREIAESLFVSVRTAEGHIYRAATKLGVRDRAGIARLLAGEPNEAADA